jgi:hypothetical protein
MPKKSVNLRAIRAALATEIASVEQTVADGTTAVKAARAGGKKRMTAKNQENLARARRILTKLRRYHSALEEECCNKQTQNCEFLFE